MDLWQLHIFCRVVERKSFSKAGEIVHLSQPTVSSHIQDLEAHFGTTRQASLFDAAPDAPKLPEARVTSIRNGRYETVILPNGKPIDPETGRPMIDVDHERALAETPSKNPRPGR